MTYLYIMLGIASWAFSGMLGSQLFVNALANRWTDYHTLDDLAIHFIGFWAGPFSLAIGFIAIVIRAFMNYSFYVVLRRLVIFPIILTITPLSLFIGFLMDGPDALAIQKKMMKIIWNDPRNPSWQ